MQFQALGKTLVRQTLGDPLLIPQIFGAPYPPALRLPFPCAVLRAAQACCDALACQPSACPKSATLKSVPLTLTLEPEDRQRAGHVGITPLLDWSRHFVALGLYSALHRCCAGQSMSGGRAAVAARAQRLCCRVLRQRSWVLCRGICAWMYCSSCSCCRATSQACLLRPLEARVRGSCLPASQCLQSSAECWRSRRVTQLTTRPVMQAAWPSAQQGVRGGAQQAGLPEPAQGRGVHLWQRAGLPPLSSGGPCVQCSSLSSCLAWLRYGNSPSAGLLRAELPPFQAVWRRLCQDECVVCQAGQWSGMEQDCCWAQCGSTEAVQVRSDGARALERGSLCQTAQSGSVGSCPEAASVQVRSDGARAREGPLQARPHS